MLLEEDQTHFFKRRQVKTGKKNSISIDDQYKTSMKGVLAAGDVTTGETLVVKGYGFKNRGRPTST